MKTLVITAMSAALLAMAAPTFANQTLAQQNGCMSCHGVDRKMVGPAFKDIAKKYAGQPNAVTNLMAKVRTGSRGVWGQVPMPPSPQVKDEDNRRIIEWVLSLK